MPNIFKELSYGSYFKVRSNISATQVTSKIILLTVFCVNDWIWFQSFCVYYAEIRIDEMWNFPKQLNDTNL